jgi:hypothetical protein
VNLNREGAPQIADVLRQLGKDALIREAEAAGLKPRGARMRCPFEGCRDRGVSERRDSVQMYPGKRGEWRVRCHRCSKDGSLIDLLAAVKGWTEKEAIAHLMGLPAPAVRPVRLVQPEAPPAEDKLKPEQVKAIWDRLASSDEHGDAYLSARALDEAVSLGLVKFATAEHPERKVKDWVRRQRLIVALMKDVVGNPRGLQARLVREPVGQEPKISSLKGSSTSKAFFGFPELIESSAVIAVAEGLADTCALAQWAHPGDVAVVGAAGKDNLPKLAEELRRCAISVEGRIFALFPQNDRPLNKSRAAFDRLGQLLSKDGAHVVMVSTNEEFKDIADWLRATPDAHWPPPALATVLGGEVEHETPATQLVAPKGGGLPVPARITVEFYGQDFSTLCALLDDPIHREAIMGRQGDFEVNETDESVWYSGQKIEDWDLARIRLGLEQQGRTPQGKILKFAETDIAQAISLIGRRNRVFHPVRDYLEGLTWDGRDRLGHQLPAALGYEESHCLEGLLLRKWMIGAVARSIEPGCKMDTCLVLVGKESARKSTFFEVLAGRDWFTAEFVNGDSGADGKMILRESWIVEWGEMEAASKASSEESTKAFLSQRVDFFRRPYGLGPKRAPRCCVIVGTTNRPHFLKQAYGNRRFWPVRTDRIDIDWVRRNRDQLLAQAVAIYRAGFKCEACKPLLELDNRCPEHRWYLEDEFDNVLREHNLNYEQSDSWEQLILDFIEKEAPEVVHTSMLLEHAVHKPPGQWTDRDAMRVGKVMTGLGWVLGKARMGLNSKPIKVYRRPTEA